MAVFVLDRSGKPLMPCSEKRARKLLAAGRARVHRVMPFVIRIVDRRVQDSVLQPLRVKIDPGSFNIQTVDAVVQGISHKYCRIVQRGDGYGYAWSITPFNTGKNNFPVSSHPLHEVAAECSIQSVALRADVASRQCA